MKVYIVIRTTRDRWTEEVYAIENLAGFTTYDKADRFFMDTAWIRMKGTAIRTVKYEFHIQELTIES